jgi:CheY-like chemotaxis protein
MINGEESSSHRKNKILVVEDHFDLRKLIVLRLQQLGYDVFEAGTGLDAFRQARAISPDLILMDLGMPIVGGDEVMTWLKTVPTRHIPIIVATAFLFGSAVDRAIVAGCRSNSQAVQLGCAEDHRSATFTSSPCRLIGSQ